MRKVIGYRLPVIWIALITINFYLITAPRAARAQVGNVLVDANGVVIASKLPHGKANWPTGTLYVNGVEITGSGGGGSGSVATDSIFDAKGDLPVGSGADTSLKLSVGTNGYVLTPDSTTSTGLKWTQRITSSNEPLGAQLYDNAGTPKLAIDFNTRRAYGTNGTDINIDWVSRILSGNWQARDVFQVSNVNDNAVFTADIGNQNNDDDNIQFYGINASGDPVFKIDGHGTLTLSDDDAVGHAVFIDVATITASRTQHWRNKSGTYAMMDDYQMSITGDSVGFKLVGDSASPGNTMLYGTNGSGVKGWYAQPSGGGGGSIASDTLWDALGDLAYGSGADTGAKLAGNTTTTKKFLRQTGNGTISAAPAWDTVTNTDVGLGSVTNDAQTKAAIVPNTAPSAGQILAGNAGGTAYAPVTLSGSGATVTFSSAGVLTLSAISNTTLSNSAITIAGTSTALGGSIALDTITGVSSNGFIKRTAANTYTNASSIDLSSADASGILAAARFPALTGDVTTSSGALATTIANGAVSLFKMANMATASLLGRNTAGSGVPEVLSTIPSAVQDNITRTGTLVSGSTGAGFTLALSTSTVTGTLADARLSANVPLLNAANTWTAANVNSTAGAASLPAMKYSGVPFAGTGTTSFPLVYINDANATASTTLKTAGTYLGVNGHGTQDLLNLMQDGVSKAYVRNDGLIHTVFGLEFGNFYNTGGGITGTNGTTVFGVANTGVSFAANIRVGSGAIVFGSSDINSNSAIVRDAVNGFTLQSAAGTATWNDASTANSGTVANRYLFGIAAPTLTATGTSVTNTVASTVYIGGAPTASTNTTITTPYALNVAAGVVKFGGGTVILPAYTVATLPSTAATGKVAGAMAYVTDATAPTYNGALTGGGAVTVPVFYDGTAWLSH